MLKRFLAPLTLSALLAAGGCSTATNQAEPSAAAAEAERSTVLVENHNWSDMTVYLMRGSSRIRLGTVTSMSERRFKLPRAATTSGTDVRIMADPIGSSKGYVTGPITVTSGQDVIFNIENNLALSNYSIW